MTMTFPAVETFAYMGATEALDTPITVLAHPSRGASGGAPAVHKAKHGDARAITHINKVLYTSAATAHVITFMRPLNYTTVDGAVAANATVITVKDDPGVYSTNYKYPLPGVVTTPSGVADNAIAANDYIAVQLKDGTWITRLVTGVASLALTVAAVPNITGGGIDDGTRVYFFGAEGDSDPATGLAHPAQDTTGSAVREDLLPFGQGLGTFPALHSGDPILVHSDNATAAGSFELVAGHYTMN